MWGLWPSMTANLIARGGGGEHSGSLAHWLLGPSCSLLAEATGSVLARGRLLMLASAEVPLWCSYAHDVSPVFVFTLGDLTVFV